jgi:NADPH-dependent glutamate synthase beta subunit-like oxidoreductase
MPSKALRLGVPGFTYPDLFEPNRLKDLHDVFLTQMAQANPELAQAWDNYRRNPGNPRTPVEISALLVGVASHVSQFVIRLFGIEREAAALAAATADQSPVFRFKIDFVRRRVLPALKKIAIPQDAADRDALEARVAALRDPATADLELATALAAVTLMDEEKQDRARVAAAINDLMQWCALHLHDPAYRTWVSFRFPEAMDHFNLVEVQRPNSGLAESMLGPDKRLRRRDGFVLTDNRMEPREILSEIHYCILCHERDKDTCSKGILNSEGAVTSNPLEIPLAGCPLDEKISEMHYLRKLGDAVGALALVAISNPMCPGTGHRICNDCMKACIYQKQDPVNIPQIETAVLTDTLSLPWGVEIYGLLTRWNPLNIGRPYALPYNGKNVLVVGMGPAGYTLAHYLANEGFGIVGVDGLKIEPLDPKLTGTPTVPPQPVPSWDAIYKKLDERILEGFGGVSEYGITVRWDKNFLTLIYLTLARRRTIRIYGGVRFGGTLSIDDAWEWGFDHIAIAAGAGRPTIIDMKNNLACGIRKASDFLMALQLTGAFKRTALPNLQVRLPAVVIGGGLTAIDTATELAAYYPVQVEKTLDRYEVLVKEKGKDAVVASFNKVELEILEEFLAHGAAIREERARAAAAGVRPDFVKLVRGWGGVSLAYRKRMVDSPAYRLNHEEIIKALEEGISFVENVNPVEAVVDANNHVQAMRFTAPGREVELPARSIMVAAGTTPNITYEKEHPGSFQMDSKKKFFAAHRAVKQADGSFALESAGKGVGFFTSYSKDGRFISYYGDNHPLYAGNVVKAMASARDGYPKVTALFEEELKSLDPQKQTQRDGQWKKLTERAYCPRVRSPAPDADDH